MYDLNSFNSSTTAIMGAIGNEATISEHLADMLEGVSDTLATLTATEQTLADIQKENEALKESNYKLFMRLSGEKKTEKETQTEDEEEETLSFESLFDEKGGLK